MKCSLPAKREILSSLVAMSRNLGANKDYVIYAEGNTSARCDDRSFFVKASGAGLDKIAVAGFVEVYFEPLLAVLNSTKQGDEIIAQTFKVAKVDKKTTTRPSIETLFHAFLLTLTGVNFVGHIHPTAVNSLLCSVRSREVFRGHIFPEEIVICGPEPVFVPYGDPGLALARQIKKQVNVYMKKWRVPPKMLLMENHGLVALGETTREVESICVMADKVARVMLGALAIGEIRYLPQKEVDRLCSRPDEILRQQQIRGK